MVPKPVSNASVCTRKERLKSGFLRMKGWGQRWLQHWERLLCLFHPPDHLRLTFPSGVTTKEKLGRQAPAFWWLAGDSSSQLHAQPPPSSLGVSGVPGQSISPGIAPLSTSDDISWGWRSVPPDGALTVPLSDGTCNISQQKSHVFHWVSKYFKQPCWEKCFPAQHNNQSGSRLGQGANIDWESCGMKG